MADESKMDCGLYTLTELVERYCIMQFNDSRKGFKNFMVFAKAVWNEVLKKSLMAYTSQWINPTIDSEGRAFLQMPKNLERLFGIYYIDDCGQKQQLFTSNKKLLKTKPKVKTCGCKENCGCDTACTSAHDLKFTTKVVEINGEEYIQKEWVKVLNSGDVMKHRMVPTLDQEEGEVIYMEQVEALCSLDVKPCGCAIESKENIEVLIGCGCYNSWGIEVRGQSGDTKQTVEFQDNRAYIIGGKLREEYSIDFQERTASACSLVPEIAVMAVMAGIDYHSKVYNPRMHPSLVEKAKYHYRDMQFQIIMDLNTIDLDIVNSISSQPNKKL